MTLDFQQIRREMWREQEDANFGIVLACSTCGCVSDAWCNCAYERFQPSQEEMRAFQIQKLEQERTRLQQEIEAVQKQLRDLEDQHL